MAEDNVKEAIRCPTEDPATLLCQLNVNGRKTISRRTTDHDVDGARYALRLSKSGHHLSLRIDNGIMVGHDHIIAQESRLPALQRRDQYGAILVEQRNGNSRVVLIDSTVRRTTNVWTVVAVASHGALVVDVDMVVIARYNDAVVVVVTVGNPLVVDVDMVVIA